MKIMIAVARTMRSEDQRAYQAVRTQYETFFASLPDDAKRALNNYASGGSWTYNEHLRMNNGKVVDSEFATMDTGLREALSARVRTSFTVWRGDKSRAFHKSEGATIIPAQPVSATFDPVVATDFGKNGRTIYLVRIEAERGVEFGVPTYDFEGEVLFKHRTLFRIGRTDVHEERGREYRIVNVKAFKSLSDAGN